MSRFHLPVLDEGSVEVGPAPAGTRPAIELWVDRPDYVVAHLAAMTPDQADAVAGALRREVRAYRATTPPILNELAPPGCIVCVLGTTEPPPPPEHYEKVAEPARSALLVQAGLLTGLQVATKYLFVYGVEAVRDTLCAVHRRDLDKPVHGGGHG